MIKKKLKYGLFSLLVFLFLTLSSCIGIKADLTIHPDSSGTLVMTYKVSKMVINIGSEDQKRENILPLPINKEDFTKSFNNISGVTLADYERKEDEENIYITVKINFKNFNDLNNIEVFKDQQFSLTQEGDRFVLKQKLAEKPDTPPDKETLKMADSIFKDYTLEYTYHLPSKIIYHNTGKLLNDGKSLEYTISIPQLLRLKQDVFLTIKW